MPLLCHPPLACFAGFVALANFLCCSLLAFLPLPSGQYGYVRTLHLEGWVHMCRAPRFFCRTRTRCCRMYPCLSRMLELVFSCCLGLGRFRFATTTAPATTTSGTRHHYWTAYLAYVPALDAISYWPSLAGQRSLDASGSVSFLARFLALSFLNCSKREVTSEMRLGG